VRRRAGGNGIGVGETHVWGEPSQGGHHHQRPSTRCVHLLLSLWLQRERRLGSEPISNNSVLLDALLRDPPSLCGHGLKGDRSGQSCASIGLTRPTLDRRKPDGRLDSWNGLLSLGRYTDRNHSMRAQVAELRLRRANRLSQILCKGPTWCGLGWRWENLARVEMAGSFVNGIRSTRTQTAGTTLGAREPTSPS
jgi:hypothetical protein